MSKPRRRDRTLVLLLAALLVAAFLWSQATRTPELATVAAPPAPPAPRAVTLDTARRVSVPVYAEGIGTVRSRRQTVIAARLLAEILEVAVSPGDRVAQGQLLVRLDDREPAARVSRAEAELRVADEALIDAHTDLERVTNLLAREAATQQDLDRATTGRARAEAERDAAQGALTESRARLADTQVSAPFAGLVHARSVDPGDLATPGRPLLELHDPDALRLEARVEERLLWSLQPGAEVEVRIDALDTLLTGTVDEIVPAIDPATRTGLAKVALPPTDSLRPGMFGRARLVIGERDALVVPREALVHRGQLELVFSPEGDGATRSARLLLVRAGLPLVPPGLPGAWIELLAGLAADTPVVVSGAAALHDGAPISVADALPR